MSETETILRMRLAKILHITRAALVAGDAGTMRAALLEIELAADLDPAPSPFLERMRRHMKGDEP